MRFRATAATTRMTTATARTSKKKTRTTTTRTTTKKRTRRSHGRRPGPEDHRGGGPRVAPGGGRVDPGGPGPRQRTGGGARRPRGPRAGRRPGRRQANRRPCAGEVLRAPEQAEGLRDDRPRPGVAAHRARPPSTEPLPRRQAGRPPGRPDGGSSAPDRRRRPRRAGHAPVDGAAQGVSGQGLRRSHGGEADEGAPRDPPRRQADAGVGNREDLDDRAGGRGKHLAEGRSQGGEDPADPANVPGDRTPGLDAEARRDRADPRRDPATRRVAAPDGGRGRSTPARGPED